MSYRDDDHALQLRHDALVRELTNLEAKVADHRRVTEELAQVRQHLEEREVRRGPVRLARLTIATPCKQRWEDMVGDERVRVCAGCEKPVFDLSAMTMEDAEAVLGTRGVTPCVRFFKRADGTVMTSDCPIGKRPRRIGLALAAGALAAGGAVAALSQTGDAAAGDVPFGSQVVLESVPDPIEMLGEPMMGAAPVAPEPMVPHMGPPPRYDDER